ncbi:MAG: hypothetical protein VB042_08355 [Victivallaceae bacterium]|nr:hypothetical protein [Victivallaceae bacterium]
MSESDIVVSYGEQYDVGSGVEIVGILVESGGMLNVNGGGVVSDAMIASGGAVRLSEFQGATISGENELGSFICSGGIASNFVFNYYNAQYDHLISQANGRFSLIAPRINRDTTLTISAFNAYAKPDGSEMMIVGNAVIASGGSLILSTEYYLDIDRPTLDSQYCCRNLSNISATVLNGGYLYGGGNYNTGLHVLSGGVTRFAEATMVDNMTAESGAVVVLSGAILMGGTTNIASGAICRYIWDIDLYLPYASACVVDGVARGFILNSGLSKISIASGLIMSGAQITYEGSKLNVLEGGIASGTIISLNGGQPSAGYYNLFVGSGGIAAGTTIGTGGAAVNYGTMENVAVASAAWLVNYGTLDGVDVASEGWLFLKEGAAARNIRLSSGGYIGKFLYSSPIISGGTDSYIGEITIVDSDTVEFGGKTGNLTLRDGTWILRSGTYAEGLCKDGDSNQLLARSGAALENTSLRGDTMFGGYYFGAAPGLIVQSGARSAVTSTSYAYEQVWGEASGSIIGNYGLQEVISGGVAYGSEIAANTIGRLRLVEGSAYDAKIGDYGVLYCSGACVIGGRTELAGRMWALDESQTTNEGLLVFKVGTHDRRMTEAMISDFSTISGGEYRIELTSGYHSDKYVLADNMTDVPTLQWGSGTITPGTAITDGNYAIYLDYTDSRLTLDVYYSADMLVGKLDSAGNYAVTEFSATISLLAAGALESTEGGVSFNLGLRGTSTANIYGGGVNASIGGSISLAICNTGTALGMIYGGSLAYGQEVSVENINLTINDITQINNPKLLSRGNTAWVVGGGVAAFGGSLTADAISMKLSSCKLGQVVGGIQAEGSGSTTTAASTDISLSQVAVSGNVYGGGYAYNGGISTLTGNSAITVSAYAGEYISIEGNIYGGGANPYHASNGGSSMVEGDSTITFTGHGDNLGFSGTVSGDGAVKGTVLGSKTLDFHGFAGDFFGKITSFDVMSISNNSQVVFNSAVEAGELHIDLLYNPAEIADTGKTMAKFQSSFTFTADEIVKVYFGTLEAGTYELIDANDLSAFDDAGFKMIGNGSELGTMAFGDTLEYQGGTLSLENDNGIRLTYTLA